MGVLDDAPTPSRAMGGQGNKFLRIWSTLDAEDQTRIRGWNEGDDGHIVSGGMTHTWRKLVDAGFDIGYTAVEHGIWRLRENRWET